MLAVSPEIPLSASRYQSIWMFFSAVDIRGVAVS